MPKQTPLERAVDLAGNQVEMARKLSIEMGKPISQQQVSNWLVRDKRLPGEYAIPIERVVNGQVTRHELRPDLYPLESVA